MNPRYIDDDARQHIFWTYKFEDPELFKNDLLIKFISSPKFCPFGWKALYYIVAKFFDPILFSKILPIILIVFCAFFLFKIGAQLGGEQVGFLSSLFFCFSLPKLLLGGYPRSFALPLLILFLFALIKRKLWWLGFSLLMQALFYPPVLLNSLVLLPYVFFKGYSLDIKVVKRSILPLFIFCSLAFLPVAYSYLFYQPEFIGPMVSYEEAGMMPEFWEGGRNCFFNKNLLIFYLGRFAQYTRSGAGILCCPQFLYLSILALSCIILFRRKKFVFLPLITWIVISSLCLFVLAHIFLFRLYLPSRYTQYTIPLAIILLLAYNFPKLSARLLKLFISIFILSSLIIPFSSVIHRKINADAEAILYVWWVPKYKWFAHRLWHYKIPIILSRSNYDYKIFDRKKRTELYSFLSSLPKEVLIVAYPYLANDIPLFTKRSVLVNEELSLAYYKNYYKQMKERLYDTFKLIYAEDLKKTTSILCKYGITHIVLSATDFDPDYFNKKRVYREPFNDFVKKRFTSRKNFIFKDKISPWVVFSNNDYWVIEVASLLMPAGN